MIAEIWKDVDGYENIYSVSNLGRIKRTFNPTTQDGILKPNLSSNGYLRVGLCKNGIVKESMIHKLVAVAFHGQQPFLNAQVRHLDDNKNNNIATNIKWGTRSDNMKDRVRNGISNQGNRNGMSKLRACCIKEIKILLFRGVPKGKIAEMFNVSRTTIVSIHTKNVWKHLVK